MAQGDSAVEGKGSYEQLPSGSGLLDDEPPDECRPWTSNLAAAAVWADVATGPLEKVLFCCPYAAHAERAVRELGQDLGDSRYQRPTALAESQGRIDSMRRVKASSRGWQSGEPGISYIIGESELEFGEAGTLALSTEFKLDPLACRTSHHDRVISCGFAVHSATCQVSVLRRSIFEYRAGEDGAVDLGQFNIASLTTNNGMKFESHSAVVLWDEAPAGDEEAEQLLIEEWPSCDWPSKEVHRQQCTSYDEARSLAFKWLSTHDASRGFVVYWRTGLYFKEFLETRPWGFHPKFCTCMRDLVAGEPDFLWCRRAAGASTESRLDLPASLPLPGKLVVAMDVYLYQSKRFAWLSIAIGPEATPGQGEANRLWRRLELPAELNHEDRIPPGSVGLLVRVPGWKSGRPAEGVMTSTLRVVRVVEDFVELWTSSPWVVLYGGLLVVAFWTTLIFVSPLVVERVVVVGDSAELVKNCFLGFVATTATLVWLEARLALCCERGRKLRYCRRGAFSLALVLSCLEKYDIYGDLNFIRVVMRDQPDGLLWKVSLATFVVGVGLLQMVPSLLLLLSCSFDRVSRLGVPRDFVLMCRFSGLHLLMESINPTHVPAAALQVSQEGVGEQADSSAAKDDGEQQGESKQADLPAAEAADPSHDQAPVVGEAAAPLLQDAASPQDLGALLVDMDDFCDVPPEPDLDATTLLQQKNLARVKKIVGVVRFLAEDLLQGILQLCFLWIRWAELQLWEQVQILGSVVVGLTVSFLGPWLETRKFSAKFGELLRHDDWAARGGPICKDLQRIIDEEQAKNMYDCIANLHFARHMRCLGPDAVPKSELRNGTVVQPRQIVRGRVTCYPQKHCPGAITQYMVGFTDVTGHAANIVPLYDDVPGPNPKTREVEFKVEAPDRPGVYPVGWKSDAQYTMRDAERNFKREQVKKDMIIGYIVVSE